MRVIELTDQYEEHFCVCLEEWKEESKDAGPKRKEWLEKARENGLKAKLAINDDGIDLIVKVKHHHNPFIKGQEAFIVVIKHQVGVIFQFQQFCHAF